MFELSLVSPIEGIVAVERTRFYEDHRLITVHHSIESDNGSALMIVADVAMAFDVTMIDWIAIVEKSISSYRRPIS